jgi:hypothetical protein
VVCADIGYAVARAECGAGEKSFIHKFPPKNTAKIRRNAKAYSGFFIL